MIAIDVSGMPGVQTVRVPAQGVEMYREMVLRDDGYVGDVVHIARRSAIDTVYGWRPAGVAPQSKLTTKAEAIARLLASEGR